MAKKTTWISEKDIKRDWYLVDVQDHILGRAATQIASLLIGKGKVDAVPNMDSGDYVVVINAEKIKVTGNKKDQKTYYRHSGYPGGFKAETLGELMDRKPDEVIRRAVDNMLPNNKHRQHRIARLMVYSGLDHPHSAQKPKTIELK